MTARAVAALGSGLYLTGPQGAVTSGARPSDGPSSDGHDAGALESIFGASPDMMLASINRGSAVGLLFNGDNVEDPFLAASL